VEGGRIVIMAKQNRKIESMAFEYTVRKCGTSSHIILPASMVGKRVKVTIETCD
jgi:putative transposon-encoded protein